MSKKLSALLVVLLVALPAMSITSIDPPSPDRAKKQTALKRTWQAGNYRNASPQKEEASQPLVFELPFNDDFADGDATRANYTFIDVDNDGVENGASSVMNKWFWKEDEKLVQHCVDGAPGNDWLITPAIHLDGKTLYKLTFNLNTGDYSNLRVTLGTSTDPADHHEILDLNNIYSNWPEAYSTDFAVEGEGNYYIGFYNYSSANSWYFNLFSISIEAGLNAMAPEAPSTISVVPDAEGAIGATIKFTTPEKLINGTPITEPVDITIYRDGSIINTLTCEPGKEESWHDDSPSAGTNKYSVTGTLNGEEGPATETEAWVGIDKPKAPVLTSLSTTAKNMNVVIEWEKVTEGLQGAYFNPEEVTYTVFRGYSHEEMMPIADGLRETTFTDTKIGNILNGRQDAYYYGVAAKVNDYATASTAKIIAVGKPLEFPKKESFINGRLQLNPWLTDPISGSFSWECVNGESGINGQDHDNGMSKFYSYYGGWGEDTDSRLKSPIFTLDGTENPMISLWMFHWLDSTVEADGGATKLIVEISVDGGEWQPLGEPLLAGYPVYGWVEHQYLLNEYKNAETVQFGLRGQTNNDWMYFYIDNLRFEEQPQHDLTLTDFYGTSEAGFGDTGEYEVFYYNRGSKTAENYTIELYNGDKLVASEAGEALVHGETGSTTFKFEFNATNAGVNTFKAVVNYTDDEYTDNNQSVKVTTDVAQSFYPEATGLTGDIDANRHVTLSWSAPVLPDRDAPVTDGAEDYEPWIINNFGEWLSIDNDRKGSGCYVDLPKWPNCETNQAFIIWSPNNLGSEIIELYPTLAPYSGNQCFLAWMANVFDWDAGDPVNDDYLVSPEVAPGTKVSFMVKGISSEDAEETYEVMYSSTDRRTESFTSIYSSKATKEWTNIEVELPSDARYFCIHYTASFQVGLMVDDIQYVPVTGSLEIKGYDVFRNGHKLNESPVAETTFTDNDVPEGDNQYSVAVIYDRGTSNACKAITISNTGGIYAPEATGTCDIYASQGRLTISADSTVAVTVYRMDGTTVLNESVTGTRTIELPRGIYIVKAGETVRKLVI